MVNKHWNIPNFHWLHLGLNSFTHSKTRHHTLGPFKTLGGQSLHFLDDVHKFNCIGIPPCLGKPMNWWRISSVSVYTNPIGLLLRPPNQVANDILTTSYKPHTIHTSWTSSFPYIKIMFMGAFQHEGRTYKKGIAAKGDFRQAPHTMKKIYLQHELTMGTCYPIQWFYDRKWHWK